MKALKFVAGGLVALAILFLVIGLVVPSYEYQSSIEANATPEKCWKIFHDTKLMKQWLEGFESLKLKSGDSLSVGSQYEIVINDHDKRMVMSETITEVTAPTKISYELNNDVLKSEYTFAFEGSSSTKITSRYKVCGNSILWRSVLYLSKSYMTSASQDQLTSLKKVIEEQP